MGRRKKEKQILKLPGAAAVSLGLSLSEYQGKCFDAIEDILASNNAAAKAVIVKMVFDATGLLRPPPPKADESITVEFGVSQPPEEKEKTA